LFASLNKGEDIDITPWVEGGDHLVHSVSGFDRKAHIKWSGAGVFTGGVLTNDVTVCWAGQPMNLSLVFEPPLASGQEASNHQWTIPGPAYADIVYTATNGAAYPLTKLTTNVVQYYWAKEFAKAEVKCKVEVGGVATETVAWFDVRKPKVEWKLTPKHPVAVTNRCAPAGGFSGPFLTCGLGKACNDTNMVGMLFEYEIVDMKGYSQNFTLRWLQLVSTSLQLNLAETNVAASISTNGLDTRYPIKSWLPFPLLNMDMTGSDDDSPFQGLVPEFAMLSREDQFAAHLLFEPSGGKPVPLKRAVWGWRGTAVATTNAPLGFDLRSPTNPDPAIGQSWDSPPTWIANITNALDPANYSVTTNLFPIPPE
jgi:hypothetical protein